MTTKTETTKTAIVIKPFKSQRAAQMMMTKVEKAYGEACGRSGSAYRDAMQMDGVDPMKAHDDARIAREAAWELGCAVYAQAKTQGFWVRSWHFSDCNPTRDLIAANMD
jgi:hypothetical protein